MKGKINILILCYTGASSSYFVEALKEEAARRKLDFSIQSHTVTPFPSDFSEYDLILIAPQVKHCINHVEKIVAELKIPVYALDFKTFGLHECGKVVDEILRMIQEKT